MAAAAAAAFHNNGRAGVGVGQGQDGVERRLRCCCAAYMMLGASFLLRAVDSDGDGICSCVHAVVGFLLWMAAAALSLICLMRRRFPVAATVAASLAQEALEAFF